MENTIEMEAPVFQINTGKHKNNIEIKGVNVSFKTPNGVYTAVKDISLSVKKGEIVSLIGHSGLR
jgi:ABC-type oligopeptide transport system ATPase subunit